VAGVAILLDTNVVSYLMRGGELADRYRPHLKGKLLAVSFVAVGTEVERVFSRHHGPQVVSKCGLGCH